MFVHNAEMYRGTLIIFKLVLTRKRGSLPTHIHIISSERKKSESLQPQTPFHDQISHSLTQSCKALSHI